MCGRASSYGGRVREFCLTNRATASTLTAYRSSVQKPRPYPLHPVTHTVAKNVTRAALTMSQAMIDEIKAPPSKQRSGSRKRLPAESVKQLRERAEKLRKLTLTEMDELESVVTLSALPAGTVLEVVGAAKRTSTFGDWASLECWAERNDARAKLAVVAPIRFYDPSSLPCVMVYLGKKATTKGNNSSSHAPHRLEKVTPPCSTLTELRQRADEVRGLSAVELERRYCTRTLKDFAEGTVFVVSSVKGVPVINNVDGASETSTAYVADYETCVDGEEQTGKIYLPSRFAGDLENMQAGILVYRGEKTGKKDKRFYDCCLLSREATDQVHMA